MTIPFSPTAAQNGPLLRAIKEGGAISLTNLAERAGILVSNINRKLDSLLSEGIIERPEDQPKHVFSLTEAGERTLAALEVYETGAAPAGDIVLISLDLLDFNPDNPRKTYDMFAIPEMAQSIADKGVLQPLMVRPGVVEYGNQRYELVIGERRLRGAQRARDVGWLPDDFTVPCQIRELSDDDAYEIMGVENLQREDLHWMDEAEFYKGLADRGRSAAQIERLIGSGVRKKRSIQERIQFARELSDDDKARTRLNEGDPNRLTVDQCRALVGDKKERPALDINPKQTLALLELLDARPNTAGIKLGDEYMVRLYAAPVGGPLVALAEKKLLAWAFDGPRVIAKVRVTEDLLRFLDQRQFGDDLTPERERALLAARVAVMGELQATTITGDEYATPELNEPPPAPEPVAPPVADEADDPPAAVEPPPHRTTADAGEAPAPASPSPRLEPPPAPDGAHQLLIIELAHKIWTAGVERGAGAWSAEIANGWHTDPRVQPMIFAKLVSVTPMGSKTLMALSERALEWLQPQGLILDNGRAPIGDEALAYMQVEHGAAPIGVGPYSTKWLNPETPAASTPEPDASRAVQPLQVVEGEVHAATLEPTPSAAPPPVTFTEQVKRVSAEGRALRGLAAANREASRLISSARTRKLSAAEAEQMMALLDAAHDAAKPFLEEV